MMDEEDKVEEYTEIPYEGDGEEKALVRIETIDGFSSVDNIILSVKAGNIVLGKIRELKENNIDELKHCISKLKTAVQNMGGDIVGIGEEFVLAAPKNAIIERA